MRTGLFLLLAGLTIATLSLRALGTEEVASGRELRVAGYLPDYRFEQIDVDSLTGLTDLILFSAEPNADGTLNMARLEHAPWEKFLTYKTEQRVRLWLAVGGWERSTHFGDVAGSDLRRTRFVGDLLQTALARRLDGIDIDWEHPRNAAEQESYGQLLVALRAAFAAHGLQLTVTIGPWQRLPAAATHAVDAVQVMSYDHEGEHATAERARKDVQALLDAGIPPAKIVLGMPFYGRHVASREATAYRDLLAHSSAAPQSDRLGPIYFNGPDTLRRKVDFAMDAGLGGVMVWELGQDAPGQQSLLRAIRDAVSAGAP